MDQNAAILALAQDDLHTSIEVVDSSNLNCVPAHIKNQIDDLGRESAEAQDLQVPITSVKKLHRCEGDRLYALIFRETGDCTSAGVGSERVAGYLKVGRRHLFLFPPAFATEGAGGEVEERDSALCVLDFVVAERHRRRGCGRALFDAALNAERDASGGPAGLAYDRPSSKMLQFLERHYGLLGMEMQPNRFAVHADFW